MANSIMFRVKQEAMLLPFLITNFSGKSRTTVKSYLAHRQVDVNGVAVTQFDHPLRVGDVVTVSPERKSVILRHPSLRIVFEDEWVIVVDKRNGLLSMGNERERVKTAYHILSEHVKKSDSKNRIFIVHRLDRETSGLMMFAKSQRVQETMQKEWKERVLDRRYVAVVEGRPSPSHGVVEAPLAENRGYQVYVSPEGVPASTRYRELKHGDQYTLLELQLDTGRKNQIRAHMQYMGHPVAGDKKYGAATDPAGRVMLHACRLAFVHPVTGRRMDFDTAVPALFETITVTSSVVTGHPCRETASKRRPVKSR